VAYTVPEHSRVVDAVEVANDGEEVLVVRHIFYGYSAERAREVEDAHRKSDKFFEASLTTHEYQGFEVRSHRVAKKRSGPPISDSLLEAYREHAERMHGSTGDDVGDEVDRPDSWEMIGETGEGRIWRVEDGWGSFYFSDPKSSGDLATFIACKMEDVMAVDYAPKFRDKIENNLKKAGGGKIGMGDKAWDAAVMAAVSEE
jgi:hypothetical protein